MNAKEQIFVFDKETKKIYHTNIDIQMELIAKETNFEEEQVIEKSFSELEDTSHIFGYRSVKQT